jgi:hypothetical protein
MPLESHSRHKAQTWRRVISSSLAIWKQNSRAGMASSSPYGRSWRKFRETRSFPSVPYGKIGSDGWSRMGGVLPWVTKNINLISTTGREKVHPRTFWLPYINLLENLLNGKYYSHSFTNGDILSNTLGSNAIYYFRQSFLGRANEEIAQLSVRVNILVSNAISDHMTSVKDCLVDPFICSSVHPFIRSSVHLCHLRPCSPGWNRRVGI